MNFHTAKAFTLLEVLIVISIIALLASMALPGFGFITRKAEDTTAISRMKRLHSAFDTHIQDKGSWPQRPNEILESGNEDKVWEWWYHQLKDFGISKNDWMHPTEEKQINQLPPAERPSFHSSFIPTPFDSGRITPYRWQQPWIIERGDFSGTGPRMVMPDGAIKKTPGNWQSF